MHKKNPTKFEETVPGGARQGISTLRHFSSKCSFWSKADFWSKASFWSDELFTCLLLDGGCNQVFFCASSLGLRYASDAERKSLVSNEGLLGPSVFVLLLCKNCARIFAFWISSAVIGRLLLVGTAFTIWLLLFVFWPGCSTSWTFLRSLLSVISPLRSVKIFLIDCARKKSYTTY